DPGAYALVGMGAMLSATTHAPVLAVVFIFEVSRDYAILLPLLLACSVSTLAARRLRRQSIYAEELGRRGIAWDQPPEGRVLESLRVGDVMRALPPGGAAALPPEAGHVAVVGAGQSAAQALRRWEEGGGGSVYVVDAEGRLLGEIGPEEERRAIGSGRWRTGGALEIARELEPLVPEQSLMSAIERLWHEEPEQLPVVDADGRLVGVLTRRDVLGVVDSELLRRNVLLAKVRWRSDAGSVTDFFELPSGYRLEQIPVPDRLVGKRLDEAGLGREHGAIVLAVLRRRSDGGLDRFVPRGADRFAPGDVLVVLGRQAALERLSVDR
ncbi:MAG: CBS domain-containing protein, partial [Planctomycetota bacterium]